MNLEIVVDKNRETPIYRQIVEQITSMVQKGVLTSGDKLPPERELAGILNTARGTVKKAYEELEKSLVIEVIQGSGSFISRKQDVMEEGRKDRAIKMIDELLDNLESIKFTHREISTFINLKLMEREKAYKKVRIAVIDCNPEALSIYKRQFSYISNIELIKFLLEEIDKYPEPELVFEEYDLLLTTSNHYNEVRALMPNLADKIMQTAVSPSQQTIIDIAKISDGAEVGIICSSSQFMDIIKNRLKLFNIDPQKISCIFENQIQNIVSFMENRDILIIPPDFLVNKDRKVLEALNCFKERGGKVIRFDYQIERGSLIYIEEQISRIMDKR